MCNYLIANICATCWLRNGFGNFFQPLHPKGLTPVCFATPGSTNSIYPEVSGIRFSKRNSMEEHRGEIFFEKKMMGQTF